MKAFFSIVLILCLLAGFTACTEPEAVTYYYLRQPESYLSAAPNGVMVGDSREAAGSVNDLQHLLILYLHGPSNDNFRSPFPPGTTLMGLDQTADGLTVHLSDAAATLKGTDLTLACACLAKTCFGLTDANSITMTAGPVSLTMTQDSLLLVDDATSPAIE